MKNYADLGGCYPPQPSASADNTLLDLHNSSYHTQPHPIIAKYTYSFKIGPVFFCKVKQNNFSAWLVNSVYAGNHNSSTHFNDAKKQKNTKLCGGKTHRNREVPGSSKIEIRSM